MSNELPDLAAYQARLLELLHRDEPITEHAVREAAGPYADALGNLDPTLLEVAATLTKTWGKIDPAS